MMHLTPQQFWGGPDINSLEKEKLVLARQISENNKPNNAKLNRWQPTSTKPRQSKR